MAMFLVHVTQTGPEFKAGQPFEEQSDWEAHAAFMNGLVDQGFIVLGGPLAADRRVAHAVEAESEEAVRATLARDPWSQTHVVSTRSSPGRSCSTPEKPEKSARRTP
jgi:hypothetical protein